MNKPFYKSTSVMGAVASIVGCVVALIASLASLKGLEITPENQALIVSLVMTLGGGVAALIGRLKASDVMGTGIIQGEIASVPGFTGVRGAHFGVEPDTPEDEECPACHGKFGAHFLNCPAAGAAPLKQAEPLDLQELRRVWLAAGPKTSSGDQVAVVLSRLADALEALNAKPAHFVKDQAGCPSKDPANPMAEGQLVGDQRASVVNG